MKNQILIIAFLFISSYTVAQTKVTKDNNGNYVSIKATKDTAHFTGHTFIDSKLKEWPVYLSATNKLYYIKTSKSGNTYKVYLKE